MKIAFIKKRFNPFGGAEKYFSTLVKHLTNTEHEIHILSSNLWQGLEAIPHLVKTWKFNSTISTLSFNHNANKAIKSLRPDCTVSFERTTCQDIYRAGDGCHKEWLQLRSTIENSLKKFSFKINPLHRTLLHIERKIFKNTPFIIANSKMVRDQIINHYNVTEERIKVIYNGVDLKRFSPANRATWRDKLRQKYSIHLDTPLILFVGSGYERKGLDRLIASMPYMDKKVNLLVVGCGNRPKYQGIAKEYGVYKRTIFTGPQKEIDGYYAASDVFVLPTIYDPFSNATLESMASGLPVITTTTNGASELINEGKNGFLLKNMLDPEELSEKINLSICNSQKMGMLAREKAEGFPIEQIALEFMELISLASA